MPAASPLVTAVLAMLLAGPVDWRAAGDGVEVSTVSRGEVVVEAVRLDSSRVQLQVVLAKEALGEDAARVDDLARTASALVAVNGGFFDAEYRPVGLRVSAGRKVAGSLRSQLGAFVIADGAARVVMGPSLDSLSDLRVAVQCGPRLVVDGKPNRLKHQTARRSMIGVDGAGRVVIVVTRKGRLLARDAAHLLASSEQTGGFGLREALALDGGPSSQLYVRVGEEEVQVRGFTPVSDALVVLPRGRKTPDR